MTKIPSYDHKKADKTLLEIYFILSNEYESCRIYGGEYLNLIGLFFHEFMFYLSSAFYRKLYAERKELSNYRQALSISIT